MSKYLLKDEEVELCEGKGCIHRFRCYRYSLCQDAIFKGNSYLEINEEECMSPSEELEDHGIYPFHRMWLPRMESDVFDPQIYIKNYLKK